MADLEVQTSNAKKLVEVAQAIAPDISLLIAYLANFKMSSDYLLDVINQVYKIAVGSGNGKISIVIEDKRVRSVHGIENRWVDKDVFLP